MAVALDNLSRMKGRRVAMLGDMRELGADAAGEHDRIVEKLQTVIPGEAEGTAYLVGEEFTRAAAGKPYKTFATSSDLAKYLEEHPLEGCTILLKGSHSIQMEKVIESL